MGNSLPFLQFSSTSNYFQVCEPVKLRKDPGWKDFQAKNKASANYKNSTKGSPHFKTRLRNGVRIPNRNVRWKPPRPKKMSKKREGSKAKFSDKIVNALKEPVLKQGEPIIVKKSTTKAPIGWMTVDTFKIGPPTAVPNTKSFSAQTFDLLTSPGTTLKPATMAPYQGTPSPAFTEGKEKEWTVVGTPLKSKASFSFNVRPWREWTRERFNFGIPLFNPFAAAKNMVTRIQGAIKDKILQFREKVSFKRSQLFCPYLLNFSTLVTA